MKTLPGPTIEQAMVDKIIKRPVVFHPDVRKVKLTYEDLETGKTISARRYITSVKPMCQ